MHTDIYKNPEPEYVVDTLAQHLSSAKTGPADITTQYFHNVNDGYAARCEDHSIELAVTPPTDSNDGTIHIAQELLFASGSPQYPNGGRDVAADFVETLADAGIQTTVDYVDSWYALSFDPYTYSDDADLARIYSSVVYHLLTLLRINNSLEGVNPTATPVPTQDKLGTRLTSDDWTVTVPEDVTIESTKPSTEPYAETVLLGDRPVGCWTARVIDPTNNDNILDAKPCNSEREAVTKAIEYAEDKDVPLYPTRRDLRE